MSENSPIIGSRRPVTADSLLVPRLRPRSASAIASVDHPEYSTGKRLPCHRDAYLATTPHDAHARLSAFRRVVDRETFRHVTILVRSSYDSRYGCERFDHWQVSARR